MARSESVVLFVGLTLAGCLVKDRPLAPDVALDGGTMDSPSSAATADTDASHGPWATDAGSTAGDTSLPPSLATDSGPANDAATRPAPPTYPLPAEPPDGSAPATAQPELVDATTPRAPDAAVVAPPDQSPVWCRPDEDGCTSFDFETEVDPEGYFGPFWCHPAGNCTAQARPALEAAGSSNHVWASAVAGDDAKALGTGMNVSSYQRTVYRHAEIDFDVWPVTAVNEESAVWFALVRVDPENRGHPLLSLVSNQAGTYVVLGPTHSPELKLEFTTQPPVGARAHVRIVLDRIDDEHSAALVTYGSETIRLSSLSMPLRDSRGAAAYDTTLGLFDGQAQRSVGAANATARYDNFVGRTRFVE